MAVCMAAPANVMERERDLHAYGNKILQEKCPKTIKYGKTTFINIFSTGYKIGSLQSMGKRG